MRAGAQRIENLLRPVITAMGYELVGVELRAGRGAMLRVYIDQPDGITVDDCERVSHQIDGVLDVENPITGQYTLEVSSPGLDRPLFEREHYRRFAGQRVRLRLATPLDGQRKFSGVLQGVSDTDEVILETDQGEVLVSLAQIESARLVPEFDGIGTKRQRR